MKSLLPILAPAPLLLLALHDSAGRAAQEPAGEPRSLLAAVPEDAIFFASVTDLAGLRAAAEKNAWGRLLGDAEFAPFWDELRAAAVSEIGEGEAESIDLFVDSLWGSLVFFVAGADIEDPDFGFLIDPGEGRASFEEFLTLVESDDDSATSYEDYGGVSLAISDQEGAWNAEFEVDGVWGVAVAASREEALELAQGMIDRLRGSAEASVVTSPLLGAARAGSFPGRIEVFADAQRLMASVQEVEDLDEQARRALDLIGLTRLSWLHGTMDLGLGEELDLHLRMALPSEGYLADWFGAFGPLPRELAALGPANAVEAALNSLDLFAIYESVWDLVADVDPAAHEAARAALDNGLQSMGGLDLEGDFLAQLTGEVASFKMPVPEEEMVTLDQAMDEIGVEGQEIPEELRVGQVFVIGLEDAPTVELFLEDALNGVGAMLGLSAASIESEEYQGFQIQSLELPMGMTLHWCFTEDYVAGSMFPSALRSVLALHGKEDAPNLLTNKHFGPHIEEHARASMLTLAPSASSMRMLLKAMQMGFEMASSASADATWDNVEGSPETEWPFADLELPDASVVDRYLDGTLIFKLECNASEVALAMMSR